jgi:hypothetical protein
MKAISIKQPWAELIVSGKKTLEIRTWNTKFRGEFWIHASKVPNSKAMARFGFEKLALGCIVGKAKIVGVKEYLSSEEFEKDSEKHLAKDLEWKGKLYGFVVEDAERVKEVPLKGRLNFFDVNL